ncbi:MAG: hypothetical protein KF785_17180 [Gemmatimonadales bacterium]|nr:hypothetical protein [Gemmatimonadales bacterium]
MVRLIAAVLTAATLSATPTAAQQPLFVALYWKAKPGMEAAYEKYIREVAEPIDAEAERDGAFDELRTYKPDTPNGEWTHLRVFRFKDRAQFDSFSAKMDEAGKRVYPDPATRPKSEHLRDLVKREVWHGFH